MKIGTNDNKLAMKLEPNRNGRLRFISYLQVIGIVLVVLGHSIHECPGVTEGKLPLGFLMMYSFRMPLFMFVSGFLMVFTTHYRSKVRSVPEFISIKVLRLLLPFAVLTLVTFIPRTFMSDVADDTIELRFSSLVNSFIYYDSMVIPYFWFLQASFILLVFNYAVLGAGRKLGIDYKRITLILTGFFFIISMTGLPQELNNIFSIDRVAALGVYFTAGMAYCSYSDKVDKWVPWTSKIFLIAVISVWAGCFFLPEPTLCSFAGITMCIVLAKILATKEKCFLDHLVGANYIIFLLSWYCNVLTQQVLHHYVEMPWWIYTILSLTSGVYIPWLVYRYLLRHPQSRWVRLTAFLLGQNLHKSKNPSGKTAD